MIGKIILITMLVVAWILVGIFQAQRKGNEMFIIWCVYTIFFIGLILMVNGI